MQGDVIEKMKSLSGKSVHLIVTSPPYNLDIDYDKHNDSKPYDEYLKWLYRVWEESYRVLVDGGRLCINFGEVRKGEYHATYADFINQCIQIGFLYRCIIVWNKSQTFSRTAWGSFQMPSNPHIVPMHEYILVFSKTSHKLEGDKSKIDITKEEFIEYTKGIWTIAPSTKKQNGGHPASFPLKLPKRLIKFYSYRDNVVLDPFGGSGTTALASYELGREYIYIDHSAKYFKIAKDRLREAFNKNKKKLF